MNPFFRLEVVAHGGGFVVGAAFVEYGLAGDVAERVGGADGKHSVVAQVHVDIVGVEFYVAVGHGALAEHHG